MQYHQQVQGVNGKGGIQKFSLTLFFSRREIGFHRQEKRFELNFVVTRTFL